MIEAGQTVDGYRVERMIGRGGMGVVYEAVQTSVNRRVALKVLRPELADDPAFVERFRREARLQASLEHPNVLEVYEVGESDERLFLAMRLVGGGTLLDLLRDGELDADRALKLLDQATGALDAAHDATLIHRDIKPQNVLVGDDEQAFLADFGLTRAGSDTTIASTSPMLGSVAYVAPEVVRGEEPTPASDRYSVGATVFHCLTGDVVFPRGSDAAVLYAHATEAPPRVHERRSELPEELDSVIAAALAKRPEDRPPTARAIVEDVRDALGAGVGRIGPPTVARAGDPAPPVPPASQSPAKRNPWTRVAIGLAVVLVAAALGAVAAIALDSDDEAPPVEAPLAAVPTGALALGSDLAIPERTVDCRGNAPTPRSPACSIVQTDLAGATVLVPEDGVITGWSVRGARGEMALDAIRPRGRETTRIGRSQWESVGNAAPHHFETRLPVEAGDQIGIELAPGAGIGITESDRATTQRWLDPFGGSYGAPDFAEGTDFDYEVAFQAEFVAGERNPLPPHLVGAAAARAPDGRVRDYAPISIDKPQPTRLRTALVEVGERVALDVLKDGRRTLRVFLPDLRAGGIPVELKTFDYPGEATGEADIWWVNPNTGRALFHFLVIGDGTLEFAG